MMTCALCKNEADLVDSHLIPRWAYKRVLEADGGEEKAPVLVSAGAACYSNVQTTKHLLCTDCEGRFSKREDYVARLTRINEAGQPRIFDYVKRLDTPTGILAELSNDVDVESIAYFAASIIWRGCAMNLGCVLGPYEIQFRNFLLGVAPFPKDAVLSMGILEQTPNILSPYGWVTEPTSTKAGVLWLHGFMVAGLAFRCFVGKKINPAWRNVCLSGQASTTSTYVSLLQPEQCPDFLAAASMAAGAVPKGKLAAFASDGN